MSWSRQRNINSVNVSFWRSNSICSRQCFLWSRRRMHVHRLCLQLWVSHTLAICVFSQPAPDTCYITAVHYDLNKTLLLAGIFTCGMRRGWVVPTCHLATEAGRLVIPRHRRRVKVSDVVYVSTVELQLTLFSHCLCFKLSLTLSHCFCLSNCLFICLSVCLSVSVSLSLSLSLSFCLCLSLSVPPPSHSLTHSLIHTHTHTHIHIHTHKSLGPVS